MSKCETSVETLSLLLFRTFQSFQWHHDSGNKMIVFEYFSTSLASSWKPYNTAKFCTGYWAHKCMTQSLAWEFQYIPIAPVLKVTKFFGSSTEPPLPSSSVSAVISDLIPASSAKVTEQKISMICSKAESWNLITPLPKPNISPFSIMCMFFSS